MNRIYKVIYSKARQCYIVVSELAKSNHKSSQQGADHTNTPALARIIAVALAAGALTWDSVPGVSWAADKDIVDKGAQPIAYDISPANDGTNIAVGKNAKVFIGGGTQEAMLSFGEKVHEGIFSMHIHDNNHAKQNLPEGIAVGTNSYARTGSIEIGAHTLAENKISIGDTTADKLQQFGVASTTLGTNSYTGGGFATTIGSYNVQSNPYAANGFWDTLDNATKNAFATVIGTFNSNESMTGSSSSGIANMIAGTANKVTNSNGAIVMGAGNSVKGSSDYFDASAYSTHFNSVTEMQKALMDGVASSAGGATLVIGGANEAENTSHSQIMGVGNKVKSTTSKKIEYNYLDGFESSITDASHVKVLGQKVTINKGADSNTVFGDYRTVAADQTNNVIIGNADEKEPLTTSNKETVILGYKANTKFDGGVALGSDAIASTNAASADKNAVGYNPKTGKASEDPSATWRSTNAAVSIGRAEEKNDKNEVTSTAITRQLTNLAAGTQDTDAVNVAQLKAAQTHFYSVNSDETTAGNYNNDGATGRNALAAGVSAIASGQNATAVGTTTQAQGNNSSAFGYQAIAFNTDSTAIGSGATAQNDRAIAIGGHALGVGSIQIGTYSTANSENAVAVGGYAIGESSVEVGSGSTAQGNSSVSVGGHAIGKNSVAIGRGETSSAGENSTAIGGGHTMGNNNVAIGMGTSTSGSYATTVGGSSTADYAVSVGNSANATKEQAVAIGYSSTATGKASTAINAHTTAEAATAVGGANATFKAATAIGNRAEAVAEQATAIGDNTTANGTHATAIGGASAGGENSTAIGKDSTVSKKGSTAIGGAHVNGEGAAAIGTGATINGDNGVAVGTQANVSKQSTGIGYGVKAAESGTSIGYGAQSNVQATAIGMNVYANKNAVAVGGNAWGENSVAIGQNSGTNTSAVAIGQNSGAWGENSVAIGQNTNAWRADSIVLGMNSKSAGGEGIQGYDPKTGTASTDNESVAWKSTNAAVSIGRAEEKDKDGNLTATAITRQLSNLAAGTQDTDAVNVAQLKAAQTHFYSVNSTDETAGNYNNDGATGTNALAAGVGASATGMNSVAVGTKAKAQNDALAVGESASAGNTGIAIGMHATAGYGQNMALGFYASVASGVTNSTALGYGSQVTKRDILQSDGSDGVVSVGKSVGQSGEKGMTRRIINVKDGVKATDAANVSQLTELKEGEHISITDSATPNEKGQTVKTISVKVDGEIKPGNTGILSGGTVYNEVHVDQDGNYIKADNTVAGNLKALDSKVKTNADNIEKNGKAIDQNKARIETNSNNIQKNGQAIEQNKSRIETNSKNIEVNSKAIEQNSSRIDTNAKNIEANSKAIEQNSSRIDTNAKNIEANSKAIEQNSSRIDTNAKNIEANSKAIEQNSSRIDTNAKNIEANSKAIEQNSSRIDTNAKNIEKNSKTIEQTSALVQTNAKNIEKNGKAIEQNSARIDTNSKNIGILQETKADIDLSNLTKAGKTVVNNIAKEAVKVEAGSGNVSVTTKDETNGPITYTVDIAKDLNVNSVTSNTITSNTVTAQTVTSDAIKTKNLSVSESASIGDVTINKGNQGTIDGLKNTAWDAKNITSGRAATEDQVKAATKNAVNYDDDTSKTITLREDTTIKNVANTAIEQGSKNAVNAGTVYNETRVKQDGKYVKASNTAGENLSVLDNQVASNSSNITNLNGRVNNLDSKVNKVGAGAAALAALHPLDFDPEDKWDFAVGYGNYRDANSVAVGAFYRPDDDTMFSVGTNFGNGENMINAGVSFKFGPKGKSQVRPGSTQEITELRATVARQDDQLKKQDNEIKELKAMVQQLMAKQDKQATTK